ncbi:Uncharacterised protein [Candidatus Bartonella washoeensis]|uniref:Uncharacterized protein n=1 Tax=Candidatus Bartonella washoeensis Sb944nv TaxID=1094563 RepID=J1J5D6_9HYPH|nr:hypothetical protein MCQ_00956 [Bartonella washoeensis Sb944nv]SPU26531.1 Uncharacterised protein [Bartonella washoeensis]
MPEKNTEEPSYGCKRWGASFYFFKFISNHVRLSDGFLLFALDATRLCSMFLLNYENKSS